MSAAEEAVFGAVDYSVFGIMLVVSLAIGIYFGFIGKKSNSVQQYLSGVQDINLTSIGISLVSSSISAKVLLAYPSEIYSYGIMLFVIVPASLPVLLIVGYVFLPVYYKTGVSDPYQYLERRFDWKVSKMLASFYVLYTYTYAPIVQYLPCLAFSQVTGLNVHMINAVIGSICIIYTMIGGIKAVIWTDVVQAAIMYISAFAVIVYGIINVGGIDVVFERSREGGRLNMFDFDPDPTKRNSFWLMLCFSVVSMTGQFAFSQTCVQRLIALKSEIQARRVLLFYYIGFAIITALSMFTGLLIYATYYKCDPVKSKIISKGDKIMPFFVMNTIGHWTGTPGLFIAAMFSAAFSTVSAQMNSHAGVVYQTFFRKWRLFEHTDFRARLFMKFVILITGIYFILAGFIIDNFGHIMQMSATITGATFGITVGTFTLGMLTPWANKHGVFFGAIISGAAYLWILMGYLSAVKNGSISYPPLPTSVEECEFVKDNITTAVNITLNTVLPTTVPDKPFVLYRLSFYSYSMVSVLLVWICGLVISFITGTPKGLDKNLIATCMHWSLPKQTQKVIPTSENEINTKRNNYTSSEEKVMEEQIPLNKSCNVLSSNDFR